ncbi:MAG: HAMP domain-containing histidine kinase [Sphingobacteriales bacterium]|nr:HAMP domain-containing histidine kinase [Sphingobacteriales bacterium]
MPEPQINTPKSPSFKSVKTIWSELIGSQTDFTLESRIFNSISISLIILLLVYIPYNFFAGLYTAAISAVVFALFFYYQYYRSRYLGKRHHSIAFGVAGVLIFGVNYFANSGMQGSTDLIWPVYLLLVLSISPYKQHLAWLAFYLICFFAIHYVGYLYPASIKYPFTIDHGQFLDRVIAFPIPVLVVYVTVTFIKKSYDQERKLTEEKTLALKASKEEISLQKNHLEQSNLEKNKLMSIISHDLRSPLLNIQNYLELLKDYELDSTERLGMEKTLLNSTNNTMEMLSNLLNWSKSQMNGAYTHLKEVNLLHTLSNTLEMELLHAAKKAISLSFHIPADILVMADEDMLQLVIRNLISNAIKFTPKGGKIHIEAAIIGDHCQIMVEDNGLGIPPEKQNQIFHIKSQPEYGTNQEKGVGLGLALCKEFTERQNGKITFESTVGKGTKFFVWIPQA